MTKPKSHSWQDAPLQVLQAPRCPFCQTTEKPILVRSTPADIAAACLLIQATWTPDERMRRLRADWRPMIACADRRLVAVAADDYETHHENHELLAAESER